MKDKELRDWKLLVILFMVCFMYLMVLVMYFYVIFGIHLIIIPIIFVLIIMSLFIWILIKDVRKSKEEKKKNKTSLERLTQAMVIMSDMRKTSNEVSDRILFPILKEMICESCWATFGDRNNLYLSTDDFIKLLKLMKEKCEGGNCLVKKDFGRNWKF